MENIEFKIGSFYITRCGSCIGLCGGILKTSALIMLIKIPNSLNKKIIAPQAYGLDKKGFYISETSPHTLDLVEVLKDEDIAHYIRTFYGVE